MPLETATKVVDLNPIWPLGTDTKSEGDDHIRMLKTCMQNLFPIGSIVINTTGDNPSTYIGGTWVAIAQGRAIVGVGNNGETTWTQGQTKGSETHTLTSGEMPSHQHSANPPSTTTSSNGAHTHTVTEPTSRVSLGSGTRALTNELNNDGNSTTTTSSNGAHTHTLDIPSFNTASTGGGGSHNNVQPSEAHYCWERTA